MEVEKQPHLDPHQSMAYQITIKTCAREYGNETIGGEEEVEEEANEVCMWGEGGE